MGRHVPASLPSSILPATSSAPPASKARPPTTPRPIGRGRLGPAGGGRGRGGGEGAGGGGRADSAAGTATVAPGPTSMLRLNGAYPGASTATVWAPGSTSISGVVTASPSS